MKEKFTTVIRGAGGVTPVDVGREELFGSVNCGPKKISGIDRHCDEAGGGV